MAMGVVQGIKLLKNILLNYSITNSISINQYLQCTVTGTSFLREPEPVGATSTLYVD